jgi:hypothetical protein
MTTDAVPVARIMRCLLAGAAAAAACMVWASSAFADSAQLTITDTAGLPDPVAHVARVFTVSGTAAVNEILFLKFRPAGGASCAPTPDSDSAGSSYPLNALTGRAVDGSFTFTVAATWDTVGSTQFCLWLAPNSDTVTTPITQVVTFRSPTGTISATINPVVARPGRDAQILVTGASEAPELVFAKVRPAGGAPCAPTADSDTGQYVITGKSVNGAFGLPATTSQSTPGQYVLCLWLASTSSDAAPIAGPQPVTFSVVQPPPVVSSASVLNCASQRHVGTVRARLVRAVCVRYRFSVVPLVGQKLTVAFVTPAHRTYKRVSVRWPKQTTPAISVGSLLSRGYKHRHGLWQAVLRVEGKEIKRTAFRVR